jgi:hypothetical protein
MEYNDIFSYRDGRLYWKESRGQAKEGKEAASIGGGGYLQVCYKGKRTQIHRVVYMMHGGVIPEGMYIDHINGNRKDNRVENLRVCTPTQNQTNRGAPKSSTSGAKGVVWRTDRNKWRASIRAGGKRYHVGLFNTIEEASAAQAQRSQELFGEFAWKKT